MDRHEVVSSNVAEVGYDAETQTLEVMFHGGTIYQYFDMPETVYQELINAPSAGRFLAQRIKGVFRCEKVE